MYKRRAAKATVWSASDALLRQGLQFGTTLVLARFVTPAEFGTVALLSLFVGVANVITEGGLSTALIQSQNMTRTDESTAFWINVFTGLVTAILFFSSSNLVAEFFGNDDFAPLMIVMGCSVFSSALGIVPLAILSKRLDFRAQLIAGTAAAIFAGIISITIAVLGFGMWAIAVQILAMSTGFVVLLWIVSGWRPLAEFSVQSARELFGFGGYIVLANLTDIVYSRAYTLVIGRNIGVQELGIYDRADQTKQLPANFFAVLSGRIILPLFSEMAKDASTLRRGVQISIRSLMLINLPIMLVFSALAEPIILTLYGTDWEEAITPFRILCLAAALWPLHIINVYAFLAKGRSKLVLRLELPKKALGLLLLFIGMFYGLTGVAWSQVAFSLFAFFINSHFSGKVIGYGLLAQIVDTLPAATLASFTAILVLGLGRYLDMAPPLEVLLLGGLAAVLYLFACFFLKLRALNDAIGLVKEVLADSDGTRLVGSKVD